MKTKKLIIFGITEVAQLAHFYFQNDTFYEVMGFTVDKEFLTTNIYCGLPVVPFEEIENIYPADQYELFIGLGYSKINSIRKEKYLWAKQKGYNLASYISSKATILNQNKIGENCFILENNTIQPFVSIGNNVTLWSGNHIGHHSVIKDHVFISSHVVVSGGVIIEEQCFLGVNATLRDHIKIGPRCVIGAGTLLLKNTESDELYIGSASKKSNLNTGRLLKI